MKRFFDFLLKKLAYIKCGLQPTAGNLIYYISFRKWFSVDLYFIFLREVTYWSPALFA